MKVAFYLLMLVGSATLVACKKENEPIVSVMPPFIRPTDSCSCTALPDKDGNSYYIKGKFEGVPVCFELPINHGADTIFNTMRYGKADTDTGRIYYDYVTLGFMDKRNEWTAQLHFGNTHLFTKSFPYQFPREVMEVCEIASMQLYWMGDRWIGERKYTFYQNHFRSQFAGITVSSFSNNILEGSFTILLKNQIGKALEITDGKFRVRLNVLHRDNVSELPR